MNTPQNRPNPSGQTPNRPPRQPVNGQGAGRPVSDNPQRRPMPADTQRRPVQNGQRPPQRNGAPMQNRPDRPSVPLRKKKRKSVFKYVYLAYVVVLVALVAAALLYVNSVLDEYENEHPQRHLDNAVAQLKADAESGKLWNQEGVPSMESGIFEEGVDQKAEFLKKLDGEIRFSAQKWINDTECIYKIISDDTEIAEIKLRKVGDPVQKLVIIGIQKYELVSYTPLNHSYTLELPADVILGSDVTLTVNGVTLTEEHGTKNEDGSMLFTLEGLYDTPEVTVTDSLGSKGNVKIGDDGKIEFDSTFYTLTLPKHLAVTVNGEKAEGVAQDDGRLFYRIRLASKAEVTLTDLFGNTVEYTGSSTVPLTYYTFMTGDNCTVKVDGNQVPDTCMEISANPEYRNFADLVQGLPRLPVYNIVVLKDNAEVTITDGNGANVPFDPEIKVQDLTGLSTGTKLDAVPEEVSSQVNVLKVLEDWSLFMSCDLNFASLSKHLIKNSYQYNVAWKYNNSIDRTFTSYHGLGNPPFEEESVTNFVWLTDNCFSVDIRFVKHMIVLGERLNDEMNERCYFVKYDDTNDGRNNPTWKLVGMKEIVDDAE